VNKERTLYPVPLKIWKWARALEITTQNNNETAMKWET